MPKTADNSMGMIELTRAPVAVPNVHPTIGKMLKPKKKGTLIKPDRVEAYANISSVMEYEHSILLLISKESSVFCDNEMPIKE